MSEFFESDIVRDEMETINDMQEEWNDPNDQYHIVKERCISQVNLKGDWNGKCI